MLHKNKRNYLVVLVALAASSLLLACDPPCDGPGSGDTTPAPSLVCGQGPRQALGTGAGGGINDADKTNATGNCLKIRQIVDGGRTKWFTSSPSKTFTERQGYHVFDLGTQPTPAGDIDLTLDPQQKLFPGFRQNGTGAAADGTGGQYDSWCKKLNTLSFAGQANWRRTTAAELTALYNSSNSKGMRDFGWPDNIPYWGTTATNAYTLGPRGTSYTPQVASAQAPRFASCVAER